MIFLVLWYLVVSLLGWATFPLAFRLLPALADRGYAVSRALGLILWGFIFWLLASLQILRNEPGSLVFAFGLLVLLSVQSWRKIDRQALGQWWRSHSGQIVVVEILFLLAFVGWAFVRAANPEAVGTEKPMELAFINAILASPSFPPHDPWLSGFAISYYYFGYVLVAMLAKITATPGGVAFNLGGCLVFALSATGAYGLLYNLLCAPSGERSMASVPSNLVNRLKALLGPLFILFVSNLEGFLHVLHTRGFFWVRDQAGNLTSSFWTWLDILDLNQPPAEPFSWVPTRFWWWWRASRVVQDYDLAGTAKEIIDEFPAFSFLLADLHPHVLAMPFAFLAMTLALNVLMGGARGVTPWLQVRLQTRLLVWGATLSIPIGLSLAILGLAQIRLLLAGLGIFLLILGGFGLVRTRAALSEYGLEALVRSDLGDTTIATPLSIQPASFLLAAIVLGGMAFLNTWDFPLYVALFASAYALGQVVSEQKPLTKAVGEFVWLSIALVTAGVLLYLPFYLGFASQAGGILPNLIYPTRGAHLWVMFAPLMLPILGFLIYLIRPGTDRLRALRTSSSWTVRIVLLLWAASFLLGLIIVSIPQAGDFYQASLGSPGTPFLFSAAFTRRLTSPGGWLTLTILLFLTLIPLIQLILRSSTAPRSLHSLEGDEYGLSVDSTISSQVHLLPGHSPPVYLYTLLLILFGILLVFGPESVYLRDQFGWRINTIFKFYFQTWLLWGIAAAFASALALSRLPRGWGFGLQFGLGLLLLVSLVYPVLSVWNKTNGFQAFEWSLDGTVYFQRDSPDEWAVIQWLKTAPPGVVAEAVPPTGGSYTGFGRVSMLSGQPAVLGWVGHESQWRGGGLAMGSRQDDLRRLYCSRDWNETRAILDRYHIRYVFISGLERSNYPPGEDVCPVGLVESKFVRYLQKVFGQGQAIVYEYTGADSANP